MNVIKAKNVDNSKIEIHSQHSIINGKSFIFSLRYGEEETLTIQLPRCQLFTGLYESDGKCYCEIFLPSDGMTADLYFRLASKLEILIRDQRDLETVSFSGHLRKLSNGSCLRLKLPRNKSNVITEFVSQDDTKVSLCNFQKGVTIIPIVCVENVYVINNSLGFNFLLKKVVIL